MAMSFPNRIYLYKVGISEEESEDNNKLLLTINEVNKTVCF